MSSIVTNLPDILSLEQNVFLYNKSFDGVLSNSLSGRVVDSDNIAGAEFILSSFFIEDFQTTRGKVTSFENNIAFDLCEVTVDNSLNTNLNEIYSQVCILQIGTNTKLEIFNEDFVAKILLPWEVLFLGERKLRDSKKQLVSGIKSSLFSVEPSFFDGILNGAIKAKRIFFSQMINQVYGKKDAEVRGGHKYLDLVSIDFIDDNGIVAPFVFNNTIKLPSVFVGANPSALLKGDINYSPVPEPFVPHIVDLDNIYSSRIVVTNDLANEDVYSPEMSFRSRGDEIVDTYLSFAEYHYEKDLQPFLSNELKMINIVREARSETRIPALTSNNEFGYKLTSSVGVHGSYPLYHMFNNNIESYTIFTDYRKAEIIVELPDTRKLNSYSIGCGHYYNAHYDAPSEWTIYGSVDGVTFFDLEQVSLNRQMNAGEIISRTIYSRPEVRLIKLYITHNNRGGGWTRIGLIDFVFFDKSYDYKIIDTGSYYSITFEPVVKVYSETDYFSFEDSLFSLAIWNDHKDLNGIKKEVGRFRISSVQPTELNGGTYSLLKLHIVDMRIVEVSFLDYISPMMIIQAGSRQEINKDGIFRDVFVEENYDTVIDSNMPWLNDYGSTRHISDSKFYDVSFENTDISIYTLEDSLYSTMLIDWEQVFVDDNMWQIPDYRLYPYIKIEKNDGDFIIIALSVSGGSLVHIHKRGYMDQYEYGYQFRSDDYKLLNPDIEESVDASMAESHAMEASSFRYRKNAKILKDSIDGLHYDSDVVEHAKNYLLSKEYIVSTFADIDVNPIVLGSILRDKMSGLINLDIFYTEQHYVYDGVSFIYYDESLIPESQNKLDYTLLHKNVSVASSTTSIDAITEVFRPTETIYLNYIDNCGVGTKCHNSLINGHMFNSIIYKDTPKVVREIGWLKEYGDSDGVNKEPLGIGEFGANISTHDVVFEHFVSMHVPQNLSGIVTSESRLIATIGTKYDGLVYLGRITIGLKSLSGEMSEKMSISINVPDIILDDSYSDFNIVMTIHTRNDFLSGLYSDIGEVSINRGFTELDTIYDRVPYFWMKMFFPSASSKTDISATFMEFNITERSFEKIFNIPYYYVDDPISDPQYRAAKSGNGDIKEVKLKDFEDFGSDTKLERRVDVVCGPERTMTYLDFQAFDHIFTSDNRRVYGNYTQKTREMLMSGFIRKSKTKAIAPGKKLADIDAMKKTLVEIQLSFIDNLPAVADWHIEDFALDYEDFNLSADQAEMLTGMQESFRGLMSAVVSTLGDDFAEYEVTQETNLFPGFPDRPSQKNGFASYKVSQFFIVKEVENV